MNSFLQSQPPAAEVGRAMGSVHAIAFSGMAGAQSRLTAAAQRIAEAAPGSLPNTLAADLLAQREAVVSFTANLRTVQAADAMLGALLDVYA